MTARAAQITVFLQAELEKRRLSEVAAVEAARWLDAAHMLTDSPSRPGLPLRNMLRNGEVACAEQRPAQRYGRWFIVRRT